MPMHDWTRVTAGTYHHFHNRWLEEMCDRLNDGLLPAEYYSQTQQVIGGGNADLLTLRAVETADGGPSAAGEGRGGLAVKLAPPRVRTVATLDQDVYAARARRVVIRHASDDRMVAVVEAVSPGNKSAEYAFRRFVGKALGLLTGGYHLLVIDPFPPGPRDPEGIHGAIWSQLGGAYELPKDKPLTLAAYNAGATHTAYVEPFAVGDALVDMPLFLTPDRYVPVPLEASYSEAYRHMPLRWRTVLERGPVESGGPVTDVPGPRGPNGS